MRNQIMTVHTSLSSIPTVHATRVHTSRTWLNTASPSVYKAIYSSDPCLNSSSWKTNRTVDGKPRLGKWILVALSTENVVVFACAHHRKRQSGNKAVFELFTVNPHLKTKPCDGGHCTVFLEFVEHRVVLVEFTGKKHIG